MTNGNRGSRHVRVDSNCPTDAILLSGNGVLTAPECDVVGMIQTSGGAVNNCTAAPAGVLVSGDPLRDLPLSPKPALPAPVQPLDAIPGPIPGGCPGSASPATEVAPAPCAFTSGNAINGKVYRIFPGYYPGGIQTSRSTIYMSPGIYWIGGGGISVQSVGGQNGLLISKALGDNTGTNPTGGVLIYNTVDPVPAGGCVGAGCYGPITLNGGAGATLALSPIQFTIYKGMVIFVDRVAAFGGVDDIVLNGGGSVLNVTGTIYAPTAPVKFNGSAPDTISAQVICYSFQVNGSGASFTIDYNPGNLFHLTGVGLVQ